MPWCPSLIYISSQGWNHLVSRFLLWRFNQQMLESFFLYWCFSVNTFDCQGREKGILGNCDNFVKCDSCPSTLEILENETLWAHRKIYHQLIILLYSSVFSMPTFIQLYKVDYQITNFAKLYQNPGAEHSYISALAQCSVPKILRFFRNYLGIGLRSLS